MGSIYKTIDVIGTSPNGYSEASKAAVEAAARTVRGISWFEVKEMAGKVENGKVTNFQVKLNVAFKVISE
jgi:flavin-binding protein dodecin